MYLELILIATFCTIGDYNDCGYLVVLPESWMDQLLMDYQVKIEEGTRIKGIHFPTLDMIYINDRDLYSKSDHGCTTVFHELLHADLKMSSVDREHSEMNRLYKNCAPEPSFSMFK